MCHSNAVAIVSLKRRARLILLTTDNAISRQVVSRGERSLSFIVRYYGDSAFNSFN